MFCIREYHFLLGDVINVDDIVETANHFRCIDLIIDKATLNITENLIKQLHFILKNGTTDSRKNCRVFIRCFK